MIRYRVGFRPALIAALVCCLAASAACTSGSGAGVTLQTPPTETSSVISTTASNGSAQSSMTSGPSASLDPTTSTSSDSSVTAPSSTSPVDPESADRAAIETAWAQYWITGATAIRESVSQQRTLMSKVAVDPALQLVLAGYAKFAKNGWTDYGTVSHHPYWSTPVGGKSTAVMGDCMDDSKAGSMDIKTGKKLTVGVARDNTRVTAVKTAGGWRIQRIEYLVSVPC